MLVLDSSTVFGFVFKDERTDYTRAVSEALRHQAIIVPPLFVSEVTNVVVIQQRRGRWQAEDTKQFLFYLNCLPLRIHDISLKQAATLEALAQKHQLTAYDASYLYVALQNQAPLATQDKALARAAKTENLYYDPFV